MDRQVRWLLIFQGRHQKKKIAVAKIELIFIENEVALSGQVKVVVNFPSTSEKREKNKICYIKTKIPLSYKWLQNFQVSNNNNFFFAILNARVVFDGQLCGLFKGLRIFFSRTKTKLFFIDRWRWISTWRVRRMTIP